MKNVEDYFLKTCASLLNENSLLAKSLPGFSPRPAQIIMTQAIEDAICNRKKLIVEAGTGTGKTFAYLIPAILSGVKTIISTGTKNLQDQLFHRDLPLIQKTLGRPIKVAMLKGRANYFCWHRGLFHQTDGRFTQRQIPFDLQVVINWAHRTQTGDISELNDIPEDAAVWPYATSSVDNCLGQECLEYSRCFVMKARRAAQEADLLVVNHHLFFADCMLRDQGIGELLPQFDAIIFDEAHQLPEIAGIFFGDTWSSRQILELLRDLETEYYISIKDTAELLTLIERIRKIIQDLRLAFGVTNQRRAWSRVQTQAEVQMGMNSLQDELDVLRKNLEPMAQRSKNLENCWKRSSDLHQHWQELKNINSENYVLWFETFTHSFVINRTPLNVANEFQRLFEERERAWIFTSATLAIGENFNHFANTLGLDDSQCLQLESPFDYENQALLYMPRGLPDPNDKLYTQAVVEAAIPVIEASGGRTFMLFTSHGALQNAAELLTGKTQYPILIQGNQPKNALLQQFRELGNAILLGTQSFWEGVDIRGEALSCVIIDKLPFVMPDDPILQAKSKMLKDKGGNAFKVYQLPVSIIGLKQGVGRLIRDCQDRGILMICDPRLIARDYGKLFLESLPPFKRTREIDEVRLFFEKMAKKNHENISA